MKVLIDNHTLVWALTGQPLGATARVQSALAGSPFTASAANFWELILNSQPRALLADPLRWWEKYVVAPLIPTLAIRIRHMRTLAGVAEPHKGPIDRIFVAQALAEGLALATKDATLARYGVPVVWELRTIRAAVRAVPISGSDRGNLGIRVSPVTT